jgi:hypothetical protein
MVRSYKQFVVKEKSSIELCSEVYLTAERRSCSIEVCDGTDRTEKLINCWQQMHDSRCLR